MLETLEFLGSGLAGHDLDQGLAGLALQQAADDQTAWNPVPNQLPCLIRALGKTVGVDVQQDTPLAHPPAQYLRTGESRPGVPHDPFLNNRYDCLARLKRQWLLMNQNYRQINTGNARSLGSPGY